MNIAHTGKGKRMKRIEYVTVPKLHPMGAQTMAIACSLCKYHGEDRCEFERCNKCMCEVESGFEYDPYVKIVRIDRR